MFWLVINAISNLTERLHRNVLRRWPRYCALLLFLIILLHQLHSCTHFFGASWFFWAFNRSNLSPRNGRVAFSWKQAPRRTRMCWWSSKSWQRRWWLRGKRVTSPPTKSPLRARAAAVAVWCCKDSGAGLTTAPRSSSTHLHSSPCFYVVICCFVSSCGTFACRASGVIRELRCWHEPHRTEGTTLITFVQIIKIYCHS